MTRRHDLWCSMTFALVLLAIPLVGCSQPKPSPTPTAPAAPIVVAAATSAPTATSLPPTLTPSPAATDTPAPTDTLAPTSTSTAPPTRTRVPATRTPTPLPTNTEVVIKYSAPQLIEPHAGDSRLEGKDDLVFKWKPVGDLGADECYSISVKVVNNIDQAYGTFTQILNSTCNSPVSGGVLQFTLNRPKYSAPNYRGLIEAAQKVTASNSFTVLWSVTVVLGDGTPLSPPSEQFTFALNSP